MQNVVCGICISMFIRIGSDLSWFPQHKTVSWYWHTENMEKELNFHEVIDLLQKRCIKIKYFKRETAWENCFLKCTNMKCSILCIFLKFKQCLTNTVLKTDLIFRYLRYVSLIGLSKKFNNIIVINKINTPTYIHTYLYKNM